ncbi:BON domain-containing protein [Eoetvoesiella caeni]|uniref:BON domain-containing protein n=1 Tax=Eoetvoesiella caeni TaxID=645616 RepID=A0A366HKS0_9BURK|nr:BON domain-containing protein [Eoetvoesiella caeni]MCI2807670.1 BON domain-containing protein [Eoetvoesiella caeni]NYT52935.1 BON domain-containing protein [Eoetvoesiella caeni]RBP42912.1 BON domain-containing protein [Eoetvoesiella caeni]
MIRSTTYTHILIAAASALALSACVANSDQRGTNQYGAGYDNTQPGNVATGPYYYRGSESNGAPVNNDATINANVIQAISQASGTGAANLQVTTLNGVVTLRGVADTQLIAQTDVQAARQVPGVQRVDYDIKVLRR